jgi:hypothetical protein
MRSLDSSHGLRGESKELGGFRFVAIVITLEGRRRNGKKKVWLSRVFVRRELDSWSNLRGGLMWQTIRIFGVWLNQCWNALGRGCIFVWRVLGDTKQLGTIELRVWRAIYLVHIALNFLTTIRENIWR